MEFGCKPWPVPLYWSYILKFLLLKRCSQPVLWLRLLMWHSLDFRPCNYSKPAAISPMPVMLLKEKLVYCVHKLLFYMCVCTCSSFGKCNKKNPCDFNTVKCKMQLPVSAYLKEKWGSWTCYVAASIVWFETVHRYLLVVSFQSIKSKIHGFDFFFLQKESLLKWLNVKMKLEWGGASSEFCCTLKDEKTFAKQ